MENLHWRALSYCMWVGTKSFVLLSNVLNQRDERCKEGQSWQCACMLPVPRRLDRRKREACLERGSPNDPARQGEPVDNRAAGIQLAKPLLARHDRSLHEPFRYCRGQTSKCKSTLEQDRPSHTTFYFRTWNAKPEADHCFTQKTEKKMKRAGATHARQDASGILDIRFPTALRKAAVMKNRKVVVNFSA